MKKGFNILWMMLAALVIVSCSGTPSYADMLKAEKKAINRLLDSEGIEVLDEYPKDGFKPNQFFKLDNDVYINVIDSGIGKRAVQNETSVLCRFIGNGLIGDTTTFDNLGPTTSGTYAANFIYGRNVPTSDSDYNDLVGEGLAAGLAHVGDSSYVKLIIPFKRFSSGSYFNSNGIPVYLKKVRYTFEK